MQLHSQLVAAGAALETGSPSRPAEVPIKVAVRWPHSRLTGRVMPRAGHLIRDSSRVGSGRVDIFDSRVIICRPIWTVRLGGRHCGLGRRRGRFKERPLCNYAPSGPPLISGPALGANNDISAATAAVVVVVVAINKCDCWPPQRQFLGRPLSREAGRRN